MTPSVLKSASVPLASQQSEFVTFRLANQWLGIPVMMVQEVLVPQHIAAVPMAPSAVAGSLNLRGQIVTAVDLRATLQLEPRADRAEFMNVVVQHEGELFAFMVDEVGDVLTVAAEAVDPPLVTLDARWKAVSIGTIRRHQSLLIVLNVRELLRHEFVAA